MPLRQLKDALLQASATLPDGAETVYSEAFDLGKGEKFETVELHVEVPALALTELPNDKSIVIKAYHGETATPTTELALLGTITGATGTDPSAAFTIRYRYPPTVGRYLRVGFIGEATVAADAKQALVSLVF